VVLTFVTPRGDVDELRDDVRRMAERWERRAMRGDGDEASGMPRASPAVEEVDRGARIVLVPEDPDDLDEVRQQARERQEHMSATGRCAKGDES
jgi:hypothetical protein